MPITLKYVIFEIINSQSQIKKKHILQHKDQFQKVLLIFGIWCGQIMLE